jgi:hypothetical protein
LATTAFVQNVVAGVNGTLSNGLPVGTDTGTANAYVVADLSPAMTSYAVGNVGCFVADNSSTASSPTVNFNNLGVKTISRNGGATSAANGDIGSGSLNCLYYDGTYFEMMQPQGHTGTGTSVWGVSPSLAGTPTAPTASAGTNNTQIATTAFVQSAISGPPAWVTVPIAGNSGAPMPTSGNKMMLWGLVNPFTLASTTKVLYGVGTADNSSNIYDLGIYNGSGTLVVHIGSMAGTAFAASTGAHTLNWVTPAALPAGKYYIGYPL